MPFQIFSTKDKIRIDYDASDLWLPSWLVLLYSVLAFCLFAWMAYQFFNHKGFLNDLAFPPLKIYFPLFLLLTGSCSQAYFWNESKLKKKTILNYDSKSKSFEYRGDPTSKNSLKLNFSETEFYCLKLTSSVKSKSSSQKNQGQSSGFDVKYEFYLIHESGLEFPLYRDTYVLKSSQPIEERLKGREIVSQFFQTFKLFPDLPLVDGNTGFEIDKLKLKRTDKKIYPNLKIQKLNEDLAIQISNALSPYNKNLNTYIFSANTSDNYLSIFLFSIGFLVTVGILHSLFTFDFDSKAGFFIIASLLIFPGGMMFKAYSDYQPETSFQFSKSDRIVSIKEKNKEGKTLQSIEFPLQGNYLLWDWYSHKSRMDSIPFQKLNDIQSLEFKKDPSNMIGLTEGNAMTGDQFFEFLNSFESAFEAYLAYDFFDFQRLSVNREIQAALYLWLVSISNP